MPFYFILFLSLGLGNIRRQFAKTLGIVYLTTYHASADYQGKLVLMKKRDRPYPRLWQSSIHNKVSLNYHSLIAVSSKVITLCEGSTPIIILTVENFLLHRYIKS